MSPIPLGFGPRFESSAAPFAVRVINRHHIPILARAAVTTILFTYPYSVSRLNSTRAAVVTLSESNSPASLFLNASNHQSYHAVVYTILFSSVNFVACVQLLNCSVAVVWDTLTTSQFRLY